MKTGTVTVRMSLDKIEQIQKLAKGRGCGVSELLREPIEQWLTGGPDASSNSQGVMDRLTSIEENLVQSRLELGALIIATLGTSAGARYLSNLCAKYGDDIVCYLGTNKPLDEKTKALREDKREVDEGQYVKEIIGQALKGFR